MLILMTVLIAVIPMCLQAMLLFSLGLVEERWANISLALPRVPAGVGIE